MNTWIASQRQWLRVEGLPGYAHELNPMELVWGNVKARRLANLCPDDIAQATPQPKPVCAESDTATSCASTSSTTQAFPSNQPRPITEGSLDDVRPARIALSLLAEPGNRALYRLIAAAGHSTVHYGQPCGRGPARRPMAYSVDAACL